MGASAVCWTTPQSRWERVLADTAGRFENLLCVHFAPHVPEPGRELGCRMRSYCLRGALGAPLLQRAPPQTLCDMATGLWRGFYPQRCHCIAVKDYVPYWPERGWFILGGLH